jgi:hypothetical protein
VLSFIQYIKQNKILNNTVTTKTISQERIINDTLIEFLPSALYGGTSLLTRAYDDAEKFKVQSINDFLIFVTQAIGDGEVDIVNTLSNECVEIKWSDLVVKDARKLLVARLNVFALTSTR